MPRPELLVLVVQSERRHWRLVERAFRRHVPEAQVEFADSAEGALRLIKRQPPEAVFVDYLLPGMGGARFIRALRAQGLSLPVVVLMQQRDVSMAPMLLREGAQEYLVKDLEYFNAMPYALRSALARHRLASERLTAQRLMRQLCDLQGLWQATFKVLARQVLITDQEFNVVASHESLYTGARGGLKCYELLGSEELCRRCSAVPQDSPLRVEYAQGSRVLAQTVYPVEVNRRRYRVHVSEDVTGLKGPEEHFLNTQRLASLGVLLEALVREMGPPVSAMRQWAQRLLREAPGEPAEKLQKAATVCQALIEELLGHTALLQTPPRELDLNGMVQETLGLRAYWHRMHGIQARLELKDIPPVRANEQKLRQMLMALLLEAEQAVLRAPGPRVVKLGSLYEPQRAAVVVFFTGASPAPGPFSPSGEGLALAVARVVSTEHGGGVQVEEAPEGGSLVKVYLPALSPGRP